MTKDMFKLTALASMITAVPVLAWAQITMGDQVGTEEAMIRAWIEAQGAQVIEIELDDGEIEVEYLLDGVEYEAELDATGAIIALESEETETEVDDDDSEDDDGDDKG